MSAIKARLAPGLPTTPATAEDLYHRLGETGHAVISYSIVQRTESADDDTDETVRLRVDGVEFHDQDAGDLSTLARILWAATKGN